MIAINPKFHCKNDLHDLYIDDAYCTSSIHYTPSTTADVNNVSNTQCDDGDDDDFYNLPLCVPQDYLDSIPWYPDNGEDLIVNLNLNDFRLWTPMAQTYTNDVDGLTSSINNDDNTCTNTNNNINNKHSSVVILEKDTTKLVSSVTRKRSCYRKAKCKSGWPERQKEKKCSHCDTETTPLWRKGPLGPNTLCNACGMRFRSGRLLYEYRPVASPSFDVNKYSNFHRRIFKRMLKTGDIKSKQRLSSSQCEEHSLSTTSFKKQREQKTYSNSKKRKRIQHDGDEVQEVEDMDEDFSM